MRDTSEAVSRAMDVLLPHLEDQDCTSLQDQLNCEEHVHEVLG